MIMTIQVKYSIFQDICAKYFTDTCKFFCYPRFSWPNNYIPLSEHDMWPKQDLWGVFCRHVISSVSQDIGCFLEGSDHLIPLKDLWSIWSHIVDTGLRISLSSNIQFQYSVWYIVFSKLCHTNDSLLDISAPNGSWLTVVVSNNKGICFSPAQSWGSATSKQRHSRSSRDISSIFHNSDCDAMQLLPRYLRCTVIVLTISLKHTKGKASSLKST